MAESKESLSGLQRKFLTALDSRHPLAALAWSSLWSEVDFVLLPAGHPASAGGPLEGLFSLGQLGKWLIQTRHLFCEVFHLRSKNTLHYMLHFVASVFCLYCLGNDKNANPPCMIHTLFSVACFFPNSWLWGQLKVAYVFRSKHSSSSFLFLAVSSALISPHPSALSVTSLS